MSCSLNFIVGLSSSSSNFYAKSRPQCTKLCAKHQSSRYWRYNIRAAQIPDGESVSNEDRGSQADDAELQRELRAKVKELFGGSENVSILVTGDRAEFTVRQAPTGDTPNSYKTAVATVASIAVISVIAGILFAYLYSTGAVHGSPQPQRRYEMPQFSSASYIDPYELLDSEREQL